MEVIQKIKEIVESKGVSDEQKKLIYAYATKVDSGTINEVCPALHRIALDAERGSLKNSLGQVIFHLQKNDRLNTLIGLQKLLEATLLVAPEAMFKVLETSGDSAVELGEKIKEILK